MNRGLIRRSSTAATAAVLLVLGVGCTGDVNSGDGPGENSPNGTPTASPTPGGTVPGGGPSPTSTVPGGGPAPTGAPTSTPATPPDPSPSTETCTSTPQVAPFPLRRLTRFEYANSVKALLGVDPSAEAATIPVDEMTNGFNNNSALLTVSSLHTEKYVLASESLAKKAVQNLAALTGCDAATKGEDVCAAEFAKSFGRRAFRRPLTANDEAMLMTAYNAGKTSGSYAEGIEVMIRAALQSPNFLYKFEFSPPKTATDNFAPLNQVELATRLSYVLWASGPDDALLDAAERGELSTREQVAARARTMLQDPRARTALTEFYNLWIGTARLDITSKNTTLFPLFSDSVRADLMKELSSYLDYVIFQGDHKLSTLLTSPVAFVSSATAPLYGVPAPTGPGLQQVTLPAEQNRAGVLTLASFLSVQAHPDQTSPVLRGKFVRTRLLCQPPPPPPDNIDISVPEIDEGATARERFSAHFNSGDGCNACHQLMDPIGFAFENFDALGTYRTMENGRVIDVEGEIVAATDPALGGKFLGTRELADKLANSQQVRDCLATQWFRFAAGRTETTADACSIATMQDLFDKSNGDLAELAVSITQTDAFWNRGVAK